MAHVCTIVVTLFGQCLGNFWNLILDNVGNSLFVIHLSNCRPLGDPIFDNLEYNYGLLWSLMLGMFWEYRFATIFIYFEASFLTVFGSRLD